MSAIALALALFVAPSWACDGPTHTTDCHLADLEETLDDDGDGHNRDRLGRGPVHLRLGLEGTGLPGAPTTGGYADLTGPRDAFLRAEGRVTTDQRYLGRLAAGIDVLGGQPFDLRLGLFIGHVGVWQSPEYQHLAIGTDITLGAELGRLSGGIRWTGGKRASGPGLWNETDVSVAFRVAGPIRVNAHWLRMDGGPDERAAGVGLGASVTF